MTHDARRYSVEAPYAWDAENRLIAAGPPAGVAPWAGAQKAAYGYDYLSRRVWKKVYVWEVADPNDPNATPAWVLTEHRKFVWSGWLMLMELDPNSLPVRKQTWGLDLAGLNGAQSRPVLGPELLEGAAGIGGLLAVHDRGADPNTASDDLSYVYFYDANGNVGQVVDPNAASATASIQAKYEYDPYGDPLHDLADPNASGPYALTNPIRFSTKYFDNETGLGYWGYRYYNPKLGRWMNRDPMEEAGGLNLYWYLNDAPLQSADALGLSPDQGAACREFCFSRYRRDTGLASECEAGCRSGWTEHGGAWDLRKHCKSACWHYRAFRGAETEQSKACEAGCKSHMPNLGDDSKGCVSEYDMIGHGASGVDPVDDCGTTVNKDYVAKVICPKLCWGATVTFWTCGTGGDVTGRPKTSQV